MNDTPLPTETTAAPEATNWTLDVSVLAEGIKTLLTENKKLMLELQKLQEIKSVNQRLHEELKSYRQGALKEPQINLLRSIARVYSQHEKKGISEHKHILGELKEILVDNEVEFVQSESGVPFNRKFMKTVAETRVPTQDEAKNETVVESLERGYVFFGEPLIQELVTVFKYGLAPSEIEDLEIAASIEETSLEEISEEDDPESLTTSEVIAELATTSEHEFQGEKNEQVESTDVQDSEDDTSSSPNCDLNNISIN